MSQQKSGSQPIGRSQTHSNTFEEYPPNIEFIKHPLHMWSTVTVKCSIMPAQSLFNWHAQCKKHEMYQKVQKSPL